MSPRSTGVRRPAHRPSRRDEIIESALALFSTVSYDDVTVGDIADRATMTPAAVYYHFTGKEQILLEGVRSFSAGLVATAQRLNADRASLDDVLSGLMRHVHEHTLAASVFYVNSAGMNLTLEAHRKLVRTDLVDIFTDVARRSRGRLSKAEAGVMGAGLVSLFEVAASSALADDAAHRGIGADKFAAAVAGLSSRIVGLESV